MLDQGPEAQGARWQAQSRPQPFDDLRDVLNETDATALVLLGPPGCGKSTLLRRLELDLALDALRGPGGEALHVIEEQWDDVLFVHQLFQEYFAARAVAVRPEPELGQSPWRAAEMAPSLEDTPRRPGGFRPAAGRPRHRLGRDLRPGRRHDPGPGGFRGRAGSTQPPLAGRCAAQADVAVPPAQRQRLQQALIARSSDPEADLRARIAAARALGDLGDPRFERRRGPDGDYLLPPLVPIEGGGYPLGSDEGLNDDEAPAHTVTLAPYAIGRFPVTNAEWQCFLEARGYEDERWWDTEAGRRWRRGEDTAEGPKRQWRDFRRFVQENPDWIGNALAASRITPKPAEDYRVLPHHG